jgi:hypothetical protein
VRFIDDTSSRNFMKNISQYNFLFAFTSIGVDIERSVNDGRGPPLFKIHGQVYYHVGSLLPPDDGPPKFVQLYIYDTTNENQNRLKCLSPGDAPYESLRPSVVNALMRMLDEYNPFVKKLRTASERLKDYPEENFIIRIVDAREGDRIVQPTKDR